MSDYKSPFIDTPLGEYFEVSPKGIAFPLQKKAILEDHPSAKDSSFYENHCGEFSEDFNIGKTDFDQLATDLKKNLTNPNFIYNWKRYISSSYRTERRIITAYQFESTKPPQTTTRVQIHRPFKYYLNEEEKFGYFDEARFNKRSCFLNPEPHYFINIDTKNLEASFKIFLFYKNDRERGFNISNYDPDNDGSFEVPAKYIAIRLTTKKATDFLAFWELIKGKPLSKSTLKSEFKELFSKNTTDEQLNFLYSIAPVSLIKEKNKIQLWEDAIRLLKYDTDRYLTDNSSNQIKVLEAIADKENGMQFLYSQFEDNPKIIKDIYTALDGAGTSQYTFGFTAHNKTIFASLLRALCNYKGQGFHRYKKFITFKNTKGYQVNSANELTSKDTSNVIYDIYDALYGTNDETSYINKERIALVQEEEKYVENSGSFEFFPSDYVHYLHPLDFVNFVIEDTDGKEITFQVPAIFLKDQAFQRNLKDLIKVIRVGLDILLVVVSVYTLAQGTTPLLTVISIIDLGLGAGDLAIQAFEEEIRKIKGPNEEPWGEDFLDAWERIYLVGGFATGVPLLVPLMGNMLKSGALLLLKATGKTRDLLIKMLAHGFEKLKNFPKFIGGKFQIIQNIVKLPELTSLAAKLQKLQQEGVIIVKGNIQGSAKPVYTLVYKDVILITDELKGFRKYVRGVSKEGGRDFGRYIEGLYLSIKNINTGTGGFLKFNKIISRNVLKQEEPMSCAAACLRQIAKDKGLIFTEKQIRKIVDTGYHSGTDNLDLFKGAKEIFGESNVIGGAWYNPKISDKEMFMSAIREFDGSFITSIASSPGNKHSIIVDKVIGNKVYIRDPWPLEGIDKKLLKFNKDDYIIPESVKWLGNTGVEGIVNLDDFIIQWSYGGSVIIKIK